MYLSHYGFAKKPFDISPNPEFLWLGEKHREGLAVLKYGILENKGFLMITGEVGTGKTALIRALQREVEARIIVASIPDPGLSLIDFYNILASELKMDRSFTSKGEFLVHFKRFILSTASAERRVLLIIDESQRLNSDLLEEIRLLSNIDLGGRIVINTFFVGQNEFKALLERPENQAVRQRITVSYELEPLTEGELRQYVEHRLKVAGGKRQIFSAAALRIVHRSSMGYPRLVNIICDHALMTGYSRGVEGIDEGIVTECVDELKVAVGLRPAMESPAPMPVAVPRAVLPAAESASGSRASWRAAAMVALFLVFAVGGWYLAGDWIAGGPGRRSESREAPVAAADGRAALRQDEAPRPLLRQPPAALVQPASPVKEASAPAEKNSFSPARPRDPDDAPAAAPAPDAAIATAPIAKAAPAPAPPPALAPAPAVASAPAAHPHQNQKDYVIHFSKDSTEIPIYATDVVAGVAALLKSLPETRAVIEGHTDSAGDPAFNRILSEGRAAAVKRYLEEQGVPPGRLSIAAYGPERPVDSNSTAEGRSRNRRVAVRVLIPGAP